MHEGDQLCVSVCVCVGGEDTQKTKYYLLSVTGTQWDIHVLRYTVIYCDILRYILEYTGIYWNILRYTEVYCDILRYTEVYRDILRYTVIY